MLTSRNVLQGIFKERTMKGNITTYLTLVFAIFFSSCASTYLKDGNAAYEQLQFKEAIHQLEKGLAKKNDLQARINLANAYMKVNDFEDAMANYEMALLDPSLTDIDRINFGRSIMSNEKYDQAFDVFDGILSRTPGNETVQRLRTSCRSIDEMKMDSSLIQVRQLGIPNVGSSFCPTQYENGLVFSAVEHSGMNKDPYTGESFIDLYYSQKEGESWKAPVKMDIVNGKYHDGMATISGDGNTMILTRSNYSTKAQLGKDANNTNNTQLYISKREEGEWNIPQPLPFNDEHYMFAHPSLSADGITMYFSSDLQGGYGGMDLYSSSYSGTEWSAPVNMGPGINSDGDDVFPTILGSDSLYYSSDSRESLGGLDVLYAVRRDGDWSDPYHMQYPINSSADDFGLAIDAGGETGYLSSDRSGTDRIYAFKIFNPALALDGMIADKKTLAPIERITVLVKNITDNTTDELITDANGKFAMDLLPGKEYEIRAEEENYFAITENISTKNKIEDETFNVILEMEELYISDNNPGDGSDVKGKDSGQENGDGNDTGNKNYPLNDIHWDYNQWNIRPDAEPYLNDLVKLLEDNPKLDVKIQSHCDSRGGDFFNMQLSKKRAAAVVDFLVLKGISRGSVTSQGYGKRKLLNNCKTNVICSEDEHQVNRRTEFIVTEKRK
ncbi:MAG: peptidoglycan-associated lipoprotein [Flavobacteriales bacterium]|jgi:peptidoglycan-associated lipoprotein